MKQTDDSASPTLTRIQQIRDDALTLEAAYPGHYDMRGVTEAELVSLASQSLIV